jgi:hypothetical protein
LLRCPNGPTCSLIKNASRNVSCGQGQPFSSLHEKTVLDEGTYWMVRSSANCEAIHSSQDGVSPFRTESFVRLDSRLSRRSSPRVMWGLCMHCTGHSERSRVRFKGMFRWGAVEAWPSNASRYFLEEKMCCAADTTSSSGEVGNRKSAPAVRVGSVSSAG